MGDSTSRVVEEDIDFFVKDADEAGSNGAY